MFLLWFRHFTSRCQSCISSTISTEHVYHKFKMIPQIKIQWNKIWRPCRPGLCPTTFYPSKLLFKWFLTSIAKSSEAPSCKKCIICPCCKGAGKSFYKKCKCIFSIYKLNKTERMHHDRISLSPKISGRTLILKYSWWRLLRTPCQNNMGVLIGPLMRVMKINNV